MCQQKVLLHETHRERLDRFTVLSIVAWLFSIMRDFLMKLLYLDTIKIYQMKLRMYLFALSI